MQDKQLKTNGPTTRARSFLSLFDVRAGSHQGGFGVCGRNTQRKLVETDLF